MSGKKVSDPNCREPALRVLRTIGVRHLFSARSLRKWRTRQSSEHRDESLQWRVDGDLACKAPKRRPSTGGCISDAADCRGRQHAHTSGVIHRDLKPANVIISSSQPDCQSDAWRTHVVDFGLARFPDPGVSDTRSGLIMGTPLYMSPEQAGGLLGFSTGFSIGCCSGAGWMNRRWSSSA